MTAKILHFPTSNGLSLTKLEVRRMSDADLVQVISFTNDVMSLRPLTDTEIDNFWLIVDERRERGH